MDARVVKEPAIIQTHDGRISISGALGVEDFHRLLAAIHDRINGRGYSEVVLDFSGCTATFAGPMLAVCAQVGLLRHRGAKVGLVLPEKENVRRLFVNTNWAHMIDHEAYGVSQFRGHTQVPVTQFSSASEQHRSVNVIMDAILKSLTDFSRGDLAAIEWSVNEITDNVINHLRITHRRVGAINNFQEGAASGGVRRL